VTCKLCIQVGVLESIARFISEMMQYMATMEDE